MGLISRVSSRTYRKKKTTEMVKRKFQIDDVVALDKNTQAEKIQKEAAKKVKRIKKSGKSLDKEVKKPGVLAIKQLPRVLDEQDLREYFEQFGKVQKLKLARSARTGTSKGFAFVLFKDVKVAKIASDTMHKYLLFNCLLKCSVIDNEDYCTWNDLFKNSYANNLQAMQKIKEVNDKKLNGEGKKKNEKRNATRAAARQQAPNAKVLEKLKSVGIDLG